MKNPFFIVVLTGLILFNLGFSQTDKQKSKEIPNGYLGTTFGDDFKKVKNLITARGLEIISEKKRQAKKWLWVDLDKPANKDKESKINIKENNESRPEWSNPKLAGKEKVKKQRVLIAIKFFGNKKTRNVYVYNKRGPQKEYYNYVTYYFYFTSKDKLYRIIVDLAKLELIDYEFNYLLADLMGSAENPKYGQPDKELKKEVTSGLGKQITYTYYWYSDDKSRTLEARVVSEQQNVSRITYNPVYIIYSNVEVGKEYLRESIYNYEQNKEIIDKLEL